MDFLQISLIALIIITSVFLCIGGWMVFLILKDTRKTLQKLNDVLYGNNLSSAKIKQAVNTTPLIKKTNTKSATEKVLATKRFFKKSN